MKGRSQEVKITPQQLRGRFVDPGSPQMPPGPRILRGGFISYRHFPPNPPGLGSLFSKLSYPRVTPDARSGEAVRAELRATLSSQGPGDLCNSPCTKGRSLRPVPAGVARSEVPVLKFKIRIILDDLRLVQVKRTCQLALITALCRGKSSAKSST